MIPTQYVYFVKPVCAEGPIKIGCSRYPSARISTIGLWSPVRLELVASAKGSFAHENALHRKFAAQRLHGEWFEYSASLGLIIDHVVKRGKLPNVGKLTDGRRLTEDQGKMLAKTSKIALPGDAS